MARSRTAVEPAAELVDDLSFFDGGTAEPAEPPQRLLGYRVSGTIKYVPLGGSELAEAHDGDVVVDLPEDDAEHLARLSAVEPLWGV
jgi:hypothetical protein